MSKKRRPPRVYWDSSCFIAWLKPEKERRSQCREVIEAAQRGELEIVTSALSLVEVVKLDKGPLQISRDKTEKITKFFQHSWIIVVQVTRRLAEDARALIWQHGLKPRDSIHAATALSGVGDGGIVEMHAFDGDLLSLKEKGLMNVVEPRSIQALILPEEPPDSENGPPSTPDPEDTEERIN